MAKRINRAIELLESDQAIYYDGPHTGHVLTYEQGRQDAGTWADYINVGMEHGAFDMTGLAEYMRGLVDGGPTRSGHRTPAIIVEPPVNGTDGPNVAFNAWQFRQLLTSGVRVREAVHAAVTPLCSQQLLCGGLQSGRGLRAEVLLQLRLRVEQLNAADNVTLQRCDEVEWS